MILSANAKELCKRGDRMFSRSAPLRSWWQETAEQFYPERADFTGTVDWGSDFASNLFDSSPLRARRDLGNAFSSMLRPRGQEWFRAVVSDEDLMEHQPVKAWCDKVTKAMRRAMYATTAKFERATKEGDHDYAAFGNAVISVEENMMRTGLLFRCHHLRDCAWAENSEGTIDTVFRDMKMSARQIRQRWPKADLHRSIERALEKEPDREFKVRHAMLPADDYESNSRRAAGMKFASVYVDVENQALLNESFSHEFRYVVPRWQTVSNSVYAVSPAVIVSLADARGMQIMARVVIDAGEKQVDPPMKAVAEAIIGDINLFAGGVTVVDKSYDERLGSVIEPIALGKETTLGLQMMMRWQQTMAESWYLNKLNLPDHGKTAYETSQLVEEYIRANIPLFEPMEMEYNAPLLDEVASIMLRRGVFGTPADLKAVSPDLSNLDLTFGFSNPLQDAIEKNKGNILTQMLGLAGGVAKISPDAIKTVDWERATADAVEGIGAPADWLVDQEAMAQQKEAQAAAATQQNTLGDIIGGLHVAGQAADVVKGGAEASTALQNAVAPQAAMQPWMAA